MRMRHLLGAACLVLAACSNQGGSDSDGGGVRELALREPATGSLARVGEVDWYRFRAVEAHSVLKVRCTSSTLRPDEELSVAVYEIGGDGEKVRVCGDHAPEGAQTPADLELNLYVDRPRDFYIAVRDLLDDEASGRPYSLSVDFAASADGDGQFSTAVPVTPDGALGPVATIGSVGDLDCYRFEAPAAGVYAVQLDFAPFRGGTDVELAAELYDAAGTRLHSWLGGRQTRSSLPCYLEAGAHYVLVQDNGRDSFDSASTYRVSVVPVACDEARENDEAAAALPVPFDAAAGAYTVEGSLDYRGDRDWYRLPPGEAPAGLRVLELRFEGTGPAAPFRHRLELSDGAGTVLLSHDFVAGSAPYTAQVLAGEGEHRLCVREAQGQNVAQAQPYAASVRVLDVEDAGEAGSGNDTIETAEPLDPGAWKTGKVAFRGDEDWYSIGATTDAPRVLEVFLETDGPGAADLALTVLRDGILRKVYDPNGSDGATRLKASVYVPAGSPAGPVTYFFRVCDAQGDDGDALVPYRLRARVVDVPAALPADAAVGAAVYFGEEAERLATGAAAVRLEQTALVKAQFAADTALLRLDGPGVTRTAVDGVTTLTFPWVGGYVDYQGDQDWFELDLGPLALDGQPQAAQWYYEAKVELHAAAPGSPVEYLWKLYRDENGNRVLVDRPGDSDGFFASAGDADTAVAPLALTTPAPGTDQEFWVGDAWAGKLYLSLGDFNFLDAALPDDDWGYETPYCFRLTLTYHTGRSSPP